MGIDTVLRQMHSGTRRAVGEAFASGLGSKKPEPLKNKIIAEAYEAAALVFETYASDQIASKRFHAGKRGKEDCDLRASIWTDAAAELRKAAAE